MDSKKSAAVNTRRDVIIQYFNHLYFQSTFGSFQKSVKTFPFALFDPLFYEVFPICLMFL